MRRKNKNVQFTNKGCSKRGILSLVLSMLGMGWLIYAVSQTIALGDQAGNILGGVGVIALLLQVEALIFAVRSLHEEDAFKGIPKAATVVAALMLLLWGAVYGLGIYFSFA